jgi:hypothetical protein
MNDTGQHRGMSARRFLQQLLDGRIRPADAASRMLDSDPSALSRRGISSAEMRDALQRFAAGDRKALEDMLDRMSRADQSIRDANELNNAREQVARVRESLGDKNARRGDNQDSPASAAKNAKDGAPGDAERAALGAIEDDAGEDGSSLPGGLGQGSRRKRERRTSNRAPGIDENGPQLKAQAQIRDGDVFVSEARVLPRAGNVSVDNTRIDAQYTRQLEQVLSNEQYPLHYKEFIRRYFLNLSEGVHRPRAGQLPRQWPEQRRQ